jgi:hypothetical protein
MIIISFKSTHDALEMEYVFEGKNIEFRTIPTPREITAGCGISLRLSENDLVQAKKILDEYDIINRQVYKEKIDGKKKIYTLDE